MKTKTSKTQKSKTSKRENVLANRLAVELTNEKIIDKRALVKSAERDRISKATGEIDQDLRARLMLAAEHRRTELRAPSECIVSMSGAQGAALRYSCAVADFGRFARAALADLIAKRDLSVAEFERQIGYSGGMVFMILRGERFISYELVGRVLARFGWDDALTISEWLILSGEAKL